MRALLLGLAGLLAAAGAAAGQTCPTPCVPCEGAVIGPDGCPVMAAPLVPSPRPRRNRFFLRVGAGFDYRRAFDRDFVGGNAEVAIGAQNPHVALGARFELGGGQTLTRLGYDHFNVGFLADIRLSGRWRLSLSVGAGGTRIARASQPGEFLSGGVMVLGGGPSVDLIKSEHGALYLTLRVAGDLFMAGGGEAGVASALTLGYRY